MHTTKVDVLGTTDQLGELKTGDLRRMSRSRPHQKRFSVVHVVNNPEVKPPVRNEGGWTGKPRIDRLRFQDPELETVYQEFLTISKCGDFRILPAACIFANICSLVLAGVYYNNIVQAINIALIAPFACFNIILFKRLSYRQTEKTPNTRKRHLGVLIFISTQLFIGSALVNSPITPMTSLVWTYLVINITYTNTAFSLMTCVLGGCVIWVAQVTMTTVITMTQPYGATYDLLNMIGSSFLLFLTVTLNGVVGYMLSDVTLRRTFLETRDSLTMKRIMEESSKEQESLLLSVLPKHVADEMVRDLGAEITGQFRKVYMNRHENVRYENEARRRVLKRKTTQDAYLAHMGELILFADIVGFTAMSSKVTPTELVYILNDLFATFDKLAQRYHQLRIKILGDCYYCISGCPDPRPDHAVVSIHMGLAMIDAISDVREKTQSGVNMRVGIHTGAVLGGVMGQHRWQYDVLGKEVSLANQMESGGLPGRVHISEVTAKFLSREFELEPGDGDQREDGIRAAGIKTFLVKSVLKPYPAELAGDAVQQNESGEPLEKSTMTRVESMKNSHSKILDALLGWEQHMDFGGPNSFLQFISIRGRVNPVTLTFHNKATEKAITDLRNTNLQLTANSNVICLLLIVIAIACIRPRFWYGSLVLIVVFIIVAIVAQKKNKWSPKQLHRFVLWVQQSETIVTLIALCIIVLNCVTVYSDMISCQPINANNDMKNNSEALPNSNSNTTTPEVSVSETTPTVPQVSLSVSASTCDYPQYYMLATLCVILSPLVVAQMRLIFSLVTVVLISAIYCALAFTIQSESFFHHDQLVEDYSNTQFLVPSLYITVAEMITVTLMLTMLTKYRVFRQRELLYYRHGLEETKTQIEQMRKKNESLIYNILPSHVAKDFIGTRKSDEELYSHYYDESGVMFASCPNFNDHYSEDAINNNGLEWMRFLNEVLSDYDDLLNESRFQRVIKIKTIGPTYMAASGINVEEQFSEDTPITVRWRHLAELVEFALALRETLERINAQSFNHFMLRIGINHGSLLAGVIGARKPHYDIWGNTVNVSSRMDSTGQLGKIQVVESTMLILKEFGYTFERRGLVKVKGKGELMTYFLVGKEDLQSMD